MAIDIRSLGAIRTSVALAGLALFLATSGPAAAEEAPLQKSYSTDAHLSCEGLTFEIGRMNAIMAQKTTAPSVLKIAKERKALLDTILKTRTCEAAPTTFGPDMYDRS